MATNSITAVILTLNEAENLSRCLSSLAWCREVIVLDSGSEDQTRAIAKRLGAKVFIHKQEAPFRIDEQRNWALENCEIEGEWVFFIDADEVVPRPLMASIQAACSNVSHEFNAYELTPRYLFWGRWLKRTQGYPNWHPRLLKRGEVSFAGGVWEHFSAGAKIGKIDQPYDHYANSKGFTDWLKRHDRYSSWDADKINKYLLSHDDDAFGTSRKLKLRTWGARFWPIRPLARFIQMYILRLGFLEGRAALAFCFLYAFYEFMTVVKIVERRRLNKGLPL